MQCEMRCKSRSRGLNTVFPDELGAYTFSCRYVNGRSQPEIVLAVGPNFVWEFFGIAARTVVTAVAGLAVLFGSGAVAAVVVIVVAVKRRQSKQAQSSELTYSC